MKEGSNVWEAPVDFDDLRRSLDRDELLLLAATEGLLSGRTVVLTSRRLLVFHKRFARMEVPLLECVIDMPNRSKNHITVSGKNGYWELKHVDLAYDIFALSKVFPVEDLYLALKKLNKRGGLVLPDTGERYKGLVGELDREVSELRSQQTRKLDDRYSDIYVSAFADSGEAYRPAIAQALVESGYFANSFDAVDADAGDIVCAALRWSAADGQIVYEGDIIATFGDDLVEAPASGKLEILDLYPPSEGDETWDDSDDDDDDDDDDESGRLFPNDDDLQFTNWLIDPIVGRILIDSTLAAVERPASPEPSPMRIRNFRDAEEAAAAWIQFWGWKDARVTRTGADEGKDVESRQVVAQVKAHANPIGRPDIQNLYGVAQAERKIPLFFSLSDYTAQACEWADRVDMALFAFDLEGRPEPVNLSAKRLIHESVR